MNCSRWWISNCIRHLGWWALATALSFVRAEPEPTSTRVVFYPGWFPSAQFAGVYVAADAGLYAARGLEVEVRPFAYGQDSTTNLQSDPNTCTLGSIEGYILLQKLDAGDDLVTLRPMLVSSPAGVMTLADSGIESAADFVGRRIGVHAFADALFDWFARNAGVQSSDVEFIRVKDDVGDLVSGHVDAMQGYASEEFVQLQARIAPRAARFISFTDMGFPSYSEILYTTRDQKERHTAVLEAFVRATREGWRLAFERPDLAIQAVSSRMPPETDREYVAAALTALEPFATETDGTFLPAMSAERWTELIRIAGEMGLVDGKIAPPAEWLR